MNATDVAKGLALFHDLSEPLLARAGVERSTMMGLPCVRVGGAFFASCDRQTGDLLVKLPQDRVEALIAAGRAHAFAPAGRRFKEWAAIPSARRSSWASHLDDAFAFIAGRQQGE